MKHLSTLVTLSMLLVAGLLPGFSNDVAAEPNASDILKSVSEHLAQSESQRVNVDVYYLMDAGDTVEEVTTVYSLDYSRPKHFSLHLENSDVEVLWVANDSGLTTYISEFGQYIVREQTPDLVDLVSRAGFSPIQRAAQVLSEFMKDAPFDGELAESASISYEGEETINGATVHHLRIGNGDGAWEMWVDAGDQPLVRRIRPNVTEIIDELNAEGVDAKFHIDMNFRDWALNASKPSDYTFVPEPGIVKVARFQPPKPEPDSMKLLGKRAPEFTLDLVGGGTLDIASKIGKEIVVLDFWATWCGPCRHAMPIISRVTDEFADNDVRLYAVNLRETVSEINGFLEGESLDVTVALDPEGAVGEQYKAYSIPQTVIIAKDGTVQVVHVGVGPTLEDTLRDELQRLVNGEVLAAAR